ncbi:MAG: hypothetical protein HWN68_03250 [Desulfobacterales bacterium]|nr:hypothetical protein [Desulfobacterales bacterium]
MRHLSFRILFLCIFLPPVLYIFSIQALEAVIQEKWTAALETRLISDPIALLEGRISIQDEVRRNIDNYPATRYAVKWGVVYRIVVKTKAGRWLYPQMSPQDYYSFDSGTFHSERDPPDPLEAVRLAKENLKVMEEGIMLSVAVEIQRNTWLANSVLLFYIFVFSFILYRAYLAGARQAEQLYLRNQHALDAAYGKLDAAQEHLRDVADKEKAYQHEIKELQSELAVAGNKVRATEDEALAEMEALEEKLHESVALRENIEKEVAELKEELESLESTKKISSRKQDRQIKATTKRFRTLYKNLDFHYRAAEGFVNLQGDLQLRAEELIHNMNEDSARLTVKRKVFSRKGALPAFESEFAYRGRLYWKQGADGKAQILAIGTKNTQTKDLAYLESL